MVSAICENPLMNLRCTLHSPRNDQTPQILRGGVASWTLRIMSGAISRGPDLITNPRWSTSVWNNLDLDSWSVTPAASRCSNTVRRWD